MMSTSNLNMTSLSAGAGDSIDHATVSLDRALIQDRNYLDLSDLLQVQKHSQPTVSGLVDFDYPSLEDPRIGLSSLSEVGNVRKIPLPAELVERFGQMQCNCLMGLFSDISRAWLSIDSDIFVWNYEDGSDLAYFDGLNETITSAGLVYPKQGIFQPHIQFLLCLTTPVDIVLLGVSFTAPPEGPAGMPGGREMHLLPEPLFSIPTDNTSILHVTCTRCGRIFLAGKDGCLYELYYQAEDGWFSRKCRKINHSQSKLSFVVPSFFNFSLAEDDPITQLSVDDSRNILYTRSDKGTIQVFDLGSDGQSTNRVAAISQQTALQNAALIARTIDKANFKPIVYIAVIPRSESSNIHLVAVTHTGVRLYFATSPFSRKPNVRPSMLSLVHVRLPPGFSARAPPQRPTNVHVAHYHKGTLLLAAAQSEDNDLLWTIASDAFPFKNQLQETHENLPIDGKTWAIAEIPSEQIVFPTNPSPNDMDRADPPAVVTQHMHADSKFVIINSQGSYLLTKQSPSDQLRQLLLDSEDVEAFFRLHKEQACATCLVLACNQNMVERQVSDLAARAFLCFGGEPRYNFDSIPGGGMSASAIGPNLNTSLVSGPGGMPAGLATPGPGMAPMQASTPFPNVMQQLNFQTPHNVTSLGMSQMGHSMNTSIGMGMGMTPSSDVIFSDRYKGLNLYLARILRPLWDSRMVIDFPVNNPQGGTAYLSSRYGSDELSWILGRLLALRSFMERHSAFSTPMMAETFAAAQISRGPGGRPGDDEQMRKKFQAEAENQESQALKELQRLITKACEALGLWRILTDHQFHVITRGLTRDQQNSLRSLTFKLFVTAGKEASNLLITNLINMYLDDHAATDAISLRLREVCPSLYSIEDQVYSKGSEKLKTAKSSQNNMEREQLLNEALERYKQITGQLDLPLVSNQFASVRFYRGVVDLSLTAAAKRDPQGLALHFYESGEPPEDQQGLYAYNVRMDCYKCITETLDYLLSISTAHPQAPSVPISPGPPPAADPTRLTNTEAEKYTEEVFEMAVKSEDQLFHVALYEWLISKQLSEKLLEIQSPFLEPFLKRATQLHPDRLEMLDLLWRYYEKTRNFSAASQILARLAERRGTDLTLAQRLEYLSRATMCAKSSTMRTASAAEGEFLHELEEKMEVARLQLQLFEAMCRLKSPTPAAQDAINHLNCHLVDITRLYGEFADRFDMSESKLAILHCAGHQDPSLIEALWQDIVEKELQHTSVPDLPSHMTALADRLVRLGRAYGATDRYFPLAFLVRYLERRVCELNYSMTDIKFVARIMQDIGITLPRLHEIYDRLFKAKDPCWRELRQPYHVLFVVHSQLETFADSPTSVAAYEKRPFTMTALDCVANYLVELQAESRIDDNVRILIGRFKALQAKLERLG